MRSSAVVRQAEISAPVVAEEYQTIPNETGLHSDSAVRDDATATRILAGIQGYKLPVSPEKAERIAGGPLKGLMNLKSLHPS